MTFWSVVVGPSKILPLIFPQQKNGSTNGYRFLFSCRRNKRNKKTNKVFEKNPILHEKKKEKKHKNHIIFLYYVCLNQFHCLNCAHFISRICSFYSCFVAHQCSHAVDCPFNWMFSWWLQHLCHSSCTQRSLSLTANTYYGSGKTFLFFLDLKKKP